MDFDNGGSWVLTTVEITMGFDEINMGVNNGGDRWEARLAWRRLVGGKIGGPGFDFAMNFGMVL